MLHLTGYAVTMEDLKKFRQVDSITAGHPENTLIRGVEVSTGPLGQVRLRQREREMHKSVWSVDD